MCVTKQNLQFILASLLQRVVTYERIMNRTMVFLSWGEGWHWGLCGTGNSGVKNPLRVALIIAMPSIHRWHSGWWHSLRSLLFGPFYGNQGKEKELTKTQEKVGIRLQGGSYSKKTRDWDSSVGSWGLWHHYRVLAWTVNQVSRIQTRDGTNKLWGIKDLLFSELAVLAHNHRKLTVLAHVQKV